LGQFGDKFYDFYDRFGELDGSGSDWNWNGLLPYFKKVG
jgi:choline dehydrogenase